MKRCPDCKVEKELSEFYVLKSRGHEGELYSYCKECTSKRSAIIRAKRIDAACEYNRKWRLENRDKALASAQRWRDANREWVRESGRLRYHKYARDKQFNRRKNLHRAYGISIAQYEEMVKNQIGLCAICKKQCTTGRSLAVDHDHRTGKIRELLCQKCNQGIGMFKESIELLESAKEYLRKHQ